ncbi:hypothetical protein UBN96_02950 [Helicobacter pylori]
MLKALYIRACKWLALELEPYLEVLRVWVVQRLGRTLEAYKDAKSTINSTTANMRDMPGHPGVRVGVETIELPKSHRASK